MEHADHSRDGSFERGHDPAHQNRRFPKQLEAKIASPSKMRMKPIELHNYVRNTMGMGVNDELDERAINHMRTKAKHAEIEKHIPRKTGGS